MTRSGAYRLLVSATFAAALLVGCSANNEQLTAIDRGKRDFHRGHWNEAIAACSEAIEASPGDAEAYVYRGRAYMGLNDVKRAIEDYDQAIKLAPKSAEPLYNRAIAYRELAKASPNAEERAKFEKQAGQDQLSGDKLDPVYQHRVEQITRERALEDQRSLAEAARAREAQDMAKKKSDQEGLVKRSDDREDSDSSRRRRSNIVGDERDDRGREVQGRVRDRDREPAPHRRDREPPAGEEQTRFYRDQFGLPVELGRDNQPDSPGGLDVTETAPRESYESSARSDGRAAGVRSGGRDSRAAADRDSATADRERRGRDRRDPYAREESPSAFGRLPGAVPLTRDDNNARPRAGRAPARPSAGNPYATGNQSPLGGGQNPYRPTTPFGGPAATPFNGAGSTPFSGSGGTPFSAPSQFAPTGAAGSAIGTGITPTPSTPFSGQAVTPFSSPAATPFSGSGATPFSSPPRQTFSDDGGR